MSGGPFSNGFSIDKDIEPQFRVIANRLMNEAVIIVDETEFRVTEVEFYLFHSELHPDPFVHCHEIQKTSMLWYFHESGYGVDLTFGCNDYYGGILIRGLRNIQSGEPFSGPWKSMYALLNAMKGADVQQSKRFFIEEYEHTDRSEPTPGQRKNLWIPIALSAEMFTAITSRIHDSEMKHFNEVYPNKMNGVFKRKEKLSTAENRKVIEGIKFFKEYYDKEYGFAGTMAENK